MARSGGELGWLWLALGLLVLDVLLVLGLFVIEPNQARVLMLFGADRGSARQPGRFTNPFSGLEVAGAERDLLGRVGKLKVNDCAGNPVEIGAVGVALHLMAARKGFPLQLDPRIYEALRAGRTTSCAASTRRSSSSSATRCGRRGAGRRRRASREGGRRTGRTSESGDCRDGRRAYRAASAVGGSVR